MPLGLFSKIICRDEEAMAAYYSKVYGLGMVERIEGTNEGELFREVVLAPDGDLTKGMLVTFNFIERDAPRDQQAIFGFSVDDLDNTVMLIEANGGKLVGPVHNYPEHGVRVVFSTDPEGALCENLQAIG